MLLNAPPVVLDLVHALGKTDLLAFQIGHPVDVVLGTHHHHTTLGRHLRDAQKAGPAGVCVDVDGREQPAEADDIVHVVDVMRIPVVLGSGTKVTIVHADLLELLLGQAEALVHIRRRDERTVRVIDLVPIQLDCIQFCVLKRRGLYFVSHDYVSPSFITGPAVIFVPSIPDPDDWTTPDCVPNVLLASALNVKVAGSGCHSQNYDSCIAQCATRFVICHREPQRKLPGEPTERIRRWYTRRRRLKCALPINFSECDSPVGGLKRHPL